MGLGWRGEVVMCCGDGCVGVHVDCWGDYGGYMCIMVDVCLSEYACVWWAIGCCLSLMQVPTFTACLSTTYAQRLILPRSGKLAFPLAC